MSSIESTLSGISDRLENLENSVEEKKEKEIPNNYGIIFRLIQVIAILFVFFYSIQFNVFSYFITLQEFIFDIFLNFEPNLVGAYSIFSIMITFLIYFNIYWYVLIKSLFVGFQKSIESLSKNVSKIQGPLLVFFLVIFVIDITFFENRADYAQDLDDFRANWNGEEQGQQTVLQAWWERTSCSWDPQCLLEKKNVNSVETSSSSSYKISLDESKIYSPYQSTDLKEFLIPYEIEAKGNEILLDKIECYHEYKNEENLISTKDLEQRKVSFNSARIIPNIYCDLSSLISENNFNKEMKIFPILYYTIITDFSQEIPFVNYDQFKIPYDNDNYYFIEDEARKKYPLENGIDTTDIINIEPLLTPEPPLLLGAEEFQKDFRLQVRFKAQSSSIGTVVNARVLSMQYPETFLTLNKEQTFPQELGTSKGESTLILPFSINHQAQIQGVEIARESIKFDIETQMKLDRESFEFILIE
jgi:hypothetical protein